MSKVRRFLYWTLLTLLTVHAYAIVETLYLDRLTEAGEKGLITSIVALVNMPLNLLLAGLRLWILRPVGPRNIYFESTYFALPILTILFCLGGMNWGGIIMSFVAGTLTFYELWRNILKNKYILLTPAASGGHV